MQREIEMLREENLKLNKALESEQQKTRDLSERNSKLQDCVISRFDELHGKN